MPQCNITQRDAEGVKIFVGIVIFLTLLYNYNVITKMNGEAI